MMRRMAQPDRSASPIQIFRPGRHTTLAGESIEFSVADLAATAAAYDPARHEAPIVVGHPRLDAPAYGWVRALSAAPELEAEPHQVDPAFADLVAAGRFKKVSASFFSPDAPGNPVPGVWYLRHVGFLGAAPPAVKGLRSPQFAADESGVVEFADWGDRQNANLWRAFREWLIGKFGLDEADRAVAAWGVSSLEEAAAQPEPESAMVVPAFASAQSATEVTVTPEEKAALEAENQRLKSDLAALAARDRAARLAASHATHASFADALVGEGRLLPAQTPVAVAVLDHLAAQEAPVEFGEGDAKGPLADAFRALLAALPKQVEFGDAATGARAVGNAAVAEFAAPDGMPVDGERAALHRKALDYQAAHPGTDYLAAVKAVS